MVKSSTSKSTANEAVAKPTMNTGEFETVLCLIGTSDLELWGKTCEQRLITQFGQNGVDRVVSLEQLQNHPGPVIMIRADTILDTPLIAELIKRQHFVLTSSDGKNIPLVVTINGTEAQQAAAILTGEQNPDDSDLKLLVRAPGEMKVNFWRSLRKREVPYAFASANGDAKAIEWRMFMGTYKGATDMVTKYLWPMPAFHVTRRIAPLGITPNMVTSIGAILTLATFFLFLNGYFITGLISGWLMTFLDTVDGKLARTTLTSTKWGNYFDHGIDLIHPPFWYMAWGYGLSHVGMGISNQAFFWLMVTIFGGYIAQRLMEGVSLRGLKLQIHIWRKIDTQFRLITARRNPNMVLLTICALFARPDLGLYVVAWWTMICLALHGIQLVQAILAHKSEGQLVSWMRSE